MISALISPRCGGLRFHGSHGIRMASKPDSVDSIPSGALSDEGALEIHGHDAADRESKPARSGFPASPRAVRRDLRFWDNVEIPLESGHRKKYLMIDCMVRLWRTQP